MSCERLGTYRHETFRVGIRSGNGRKKKLEMSCKRLGKYGLKLALKCIKKISENDRNKDLKKKVPIDLTVIPTYGKQS